MYSGSAVMLAITLPCFHLLQSRRDTADRLLQSLGPSAVLIPPSNHPDVMAGQGTIAMEMLEQVT